MNENVIFVGHRPNRGPPRQWSGYFKKPRSAFFIKKRGFLMKFEGFRSMRKPNEGCERSQPWLPDDLLQAINISPSDDRRDATEENPDHASARATLNASGLPKHSTQDQQQDARCEASAASDAARARAILFPRCP